MGKHPNLAIKGNPEAGEKLALAAKKFCAAFSGPQAHEMMAMDEGWAAQAAKAALGDESAIFGEGFGDRLDAEGKIAMLLMFHNAYFVDRAAGRCGYGSKENFEKTSRALSWCEREPAEFWKAFTKRFGQHRRNGTCMAMLCAACPGLAAVHAKKQEWAIGLPNLAPEGLGLRVLWEGVRANPKAKLWKSINWDNYRLAADDAAGQTEQLCKGLLTYPFEGQDAADVGKFRLGVLKALARRALTSDETGFSLVEMVKLASSLPGGPGLLEAKKGETGIFDVLAQSFPYMNEKRMRQALPALRMLMPQAAPGKVKALGKSIACQMGRLDAQNRSGAGVDGLAAALDEAFGQGLLLTDCFSVKLRDDATVEEQIKRKLAKFADRKAADYFISKMERARLAQGLGEDSGAQALMLSARTLPESKLAEFSNLMEALGEDAEARFEQFLSQLRAEAEQKVAGREPPAAAAARPSRRI